MNPSVPILRAIFPGQHWLDDRTWRIVWSRIHSGWRSAIQRAPFPIAVLAALDRANRARERRSRRRHPVAPARRLSLNLLLLVNRCQGAFHFTDFKCPLVAHDYVGRQDSLVDGNWAKPSRKSALTASLPLRTIPLLGSVSQDVATRMFQFVDYPSGTT